MEASEVQRALHAAARKPAPEQTRMLRKLLGHPETGPKALEVLHAAVMQASAAHDASSLLLEVYELLLALPDSPIAAHATPDAIEALALVSESSIFVDALDAVIRAVPAPVRAELLLRPRVAERVIASCSIMGHVLLRATPTEVQRCLSVVAATGVQVVVHVADHDDAVRFSQCVERAEVPPVELVVHARHDSSLEDWIASSSSLRGMLASLHMVTVELPESPASNTSGIDNVLALLKALSNGELRARGSLGNDKLAVCVMAREKNWAHKHSVNVSAVAKLVECLKITARQGATFLDASALARLTDAAMDTARAIGSLAVELCLHATDGASIAIDAVSNVAGRANMLYCTRSESEWHTEVVSNALCSSARPYLAVILVSNTVDVANDLIAAHKHGSPLALEAVIAQTGDVHQLVHALCQRSAPIVNLRLKHAHDLYRRSRKSTDDSDKEVVLRAASMPSLKCLSISGTDGDKLIEDAVTVLGQNKTLIALAVSASQCRYNFRGKSYSAAIEAVADGIRANTTLVELCIEVDRDIYDQCTPLVESVEANTALHTVSVFALKAKAAADELGKRGDGARPCSAQLGALSVNPGIEAYSDGLLALSAWIRHATPASTVHTEAVERLLLSFANRRPLWRVVDVLNRLAATVPSASPVVHDAFCAHVLPRVSDHRVDHAIRAVATDVVRFTAVRLEAEATLAEESGATCSSFLRSLANAMTQAEPADRRALHDTTDLLDVHAAAGIIRLRALDGTEVPMSWAAITGSGVLTRCLTRAQAGVAQAGGDTLDVNGIEDGETLSRVVALLEQDAATGCLPSCTDTYTAVSDARALARVVIGAGYLDAPRVSRWAGSEFAVALCARLRELPVGAGSQLVRSLAA